MFEYETISYFLNEFQDKIKSELNEFFELDYDERLQRTYNAIDTILEHLNEFFEKIEKEDKKELIEFLAKQNNKTLAIKFSHILPLQETIALYFADKSILVEVMNYYIESINYMLENSA
jgi:NH3-dependent NAD+ synthetase